ncbi:hypothetical protein SNE40_023294 [Patella caerulea]|uniref:Rho GTPase activating protein n=1 Tax=Patella caerulea TaxID=87958 RepID=A0AAN8G2R2_PATCE
MSDLDTTLEEDVNYRRVKVLYDYSYTDSDIEEDVAMHTGEEFFLIQETNDEWWEVCRKKDSIPFFVPAQYVEIIDNVSVTDENSNKEAIKNVPSNNQDQGVNKASQEPSNIPSSTKEVIYANLDEYRAKANIPQPPAKLELADNDGPSGEYANLAFIQSSIHPPSVEQGDYLHVLLEPLPWDVYKDRYSGREFFHNRDTNETTWKPPRKARTPTSPPPETIGKTVEKTHKRTGSVPEIIESKSAIDEYHVKIEHGDTIYTHKVTEERWKKAVDDNQSEYYISLDRNETVWELPSKVGRKVSFIPKVEEPANGDVGGQNDKFSLSLPRSTKSRSVHGGEKLRQSLENALSKSSTLPPNFSPANQMQIHSSTSSDNIPTNLTKTGRPTFKAIQQPERPLAATFNTSRLSEVGKKVKKNWSSSYLVLKQSNLVFYKDEKAATQKQPGSPHGKTDQVVSLKGATIQLNPKIVTSKKNVLLLTTSNGSKYLLQSDEETVLKWIAELTLAAGGTNENTSHAQREEKKGMPRSLSEDGSSARNIWNIKTKLLSLMRTRPAQEDLVKRGIIKDSVFGSRLKDLCEKEHAKVPKFVCLCVAAVEKRGLDHDGIYRVSGNLAEIQRLRYVVDKEESYNLDDKQWDMNVLTGALKLFFRELKEPLIPFDMFDMFAAAVQKEMYSEKFKFMKELLPELPRCNYETMKFLFQHLILVTKESQKNRMQIHNLAIVFGPTLSWKNDADAQNLAVLTVFQSRIVEFMLLEFDKLFK